MKRMHDGREMRMGQVSGEASDGDYVPPVPISREELQRPSKGEDGGARSESRRASKGRGSARKPKRRRPHKVTPQPKPMWPIYLLIAGAVFYFFMPWDLIPDVLIGPGQVDDFGLFYVAYKKWRERKQHNGMAQQFQEPMYGGRATEDAWHDQRMVRQPRCHVNFCEPIVEETGLFARMWKAAMFIWKGGAL